MQVEGPVEKTGKNRRGKRLKKCVEKYKQLVDQEEPKTKTTPPKQTKKKKKKKTQKKKKKPQKTNQNPKPNKTQGGRRKEPFRIDGEGELIRRTHEENIPPR